MELPELIIEEHDEYTIFTVRNDSLEELYEAIQDHLFPVEIEFEGEGITLESGIEEYRDQQLTGEVAAIIDGVTLNTGDRILLQNNRLKPAWYSWRNLSRKYWKSDAKQNGIYEVTSSGSWVKPEPRLQLNEPDR